MKILKLYIKEYKKFQNQTIVFDSENKSKIQYDLFKNMNITLLSGENGSGKSTILSFIAKIFRYLQRYRERIPCDFVLEYQIGYMNEEYIIELSKKDKYIYIKINEKLYIIQEFDLKKRRYVKYEQCSMEQISYDDICKYLPNKVIVLGFDTDYARLWYSNNYFGDRKVEFVDINDSFQDTGIGLDFSSGILEFYDRLYNNSQLENVMKSIGISFSPLVDIYLYFKEYDYESFADEARIEKKYFTYSFWEKYILLEEGMNKKINLKEFIKNEKLKKVLRLFIENRLIYINEFYIQKGKSTFKLSGMSTGEKIFLCNLFFVCSRIENNSILIWEEPETHLNMKWSKQLIPLIVILFEELNLHVLLSSHEKGLINSLFSNQILRLYQGEIRNPDFQTFLANEVEISNKLFFAEYDYNYFETYILEVIKDSDKEQLEKLLNLLGESFYKFLIYKRLN